VIFNIALSGTAQLNVDYALDISGNTVIIPKGQASLDIKAGIRPATTGPLSSMLYWRRSRTTAAPI
jgi:hypothetical protein